MKYRVSFDLDLKRNPYKGLYIAFEGVDGSGKTTQATALQKFFEEQNQKVVVTSEPKVDLPGGDLIMQFFRGEVDVSGQAFQYWMSANRAINQDTIVLPALKRGEVVITDRCYWSAIPYGLMDNNVAFNKKEAQLMLVTQGLLSHYHQFISPDIVFYIDISPEVGLSRSLAKKGRREGDVYEKKDKLEQVVRGYRWLTREFSREFVTIDGERDTKEVTAKVIGYLKELKKVSNES